MTLWNCVLYYNMYSLYIGSVHVCCHSFGQYFGACAV